MMKRARNTRVVLLAILILLVALSAGVYLLVKWRDRARNRWAAQGTLMPFTDWYGNWGICDVNSNGLFIWITGNYQGGGPSFHRMPGGIRMEHSGTVVQVHDAADCLVVIMPDRTMQRISLEPGEAPQLASRLQKIVLDSRYEQSITSALLEADGRFDREFRSLFARQMKAEDLRWLEIQESWGRAATSRRSWH